MLTTDTFKTQSTARLTERQFDSFVDQESGLDGWEQLYRQLSPGAFHGNIMSLEWDGITLYRERLNRRMENVYRVPEGCICIGFPLNAPVALTPNGMTNEPGGGLIHVAGEEYHIFTGPKSDYIILTLNRDILPDQITTTTRRISAAEGRSMAGWMTSLLESARSGLASDGLLSLAPDMLVDRISAWADHGHSRSGAANHARRLMNEIIAACDRLEADEITVGHLSRLLDRDRAVLRAACLETTGIRLDDVLKGRRLSEVHRRLRRSDPKSTRVSDVAMDFGYLHWGRFAETYRKMFGECPSDTLKRPSTAQTVTRRGEYRSTARPAIGDRSCERSALGRVEAGAG